MGKQTDHISKEHREWIVQQPLFFVATAMQEGHINLSPKGMDTFRILDENRICWLNLTGSGNETATHLLHSDRMTIMFNAFEGNPKILRLYGTAKCYHTKDKEYHQYISLFPDMPGTRQVVEMTVSLVQSSCGFGVPLMDYKGDRSMLTEWAEKKGSDGIKDYWAEKNTTSLDGHSTHILDQ